MNNQSPFKWRHFESEIILLCVRWYLRYARSLPRPGGDNAGTGAPRRSYHHVPLGPALRSGTRQTLSAASLQPTTIPGEWMRRTSR
jgi:hypothetical protein